MDFGWVSQIGLSSYFVRLVKVLLVAFLCGKFGLITGPNYSYKKDKIKVLIRA
jgi:hypothetical protein